ncbi:MAG: ABC transporter permease [Candidatus Thermoplasmatota archaeon]|nr:ABC transporter permease [Candidatus Thermoplasmatota archaeon]MBS3790396.1 ABC transporter permease [Candidatus Thermoplasmatota archaeon]
MKRAFSLFLSLTKNWLRSKSGVFFSILFPIMLLLIFSTVFGGQEAAEYTLHVQNDDLVDGNETELSEEFIEALDSSESLNVKEVDNITEDRQDRSFGSYRALRIEEGFHEQAKNKSIELRMKVIQNTTQYMDEQGEEINLDDFTAESAEIVLMLSEDDQAGPMVKGTVYGVINSFNSRMLGLEEGDTTVDITEESHKERGLHPVDYYLPGFIAAFIMSNGIIGVTSNISEYKRNGVLKRLTATPLKKRDWILANVGQQTVLAFGLTAVMILVAVLIFDAQAYPGPYAIGLIFMGAVAFCSVGIVLGGLIKDVEAASGAGNAIAFPMMFLSGAFIPIETMPDYLQTVARFLPLYYFHQGLREIMILQNPSEALLAYLIIGIFAMIFIVLAIKTTRWKDI